MSKYMVRLEAGAYAYIQVEADSPEDALEEAFEQTPRICAQCSGWGQDGVSLDLGEFDVPLNKDGSEANDAVEEMES